MDSYSWYLQLKKPRWAPPASPFGPVWSVLYLIIFVSFGFVLFNAATSTIPWVVAVPFALNLVLNFSLFYHSNHIALGRETANRFCTGMRQAMPYAPGNHC